MRMFIVFLILCGLNVNISAHVQTNINEVTDLFERNIEDKEGLFKEMKSQNENAVSLWMLPPGKPINTSTPP